MVFDVALNGKTYEVDDDGGRITIDGAPLTVLSDDPSVKSRYALETEVLARDARMRTHAQQAFSAMLRRQVR